MIKYIIENTKKSAKKKSAPKINECIHPQQPQTHKSKITF
jgi:hypothetical protein